LLFLFKSSTGSGLKSELFMMFETPIKSRSYYSTPRKI